MTIDEKLDGLLAHRFGPAYRDRRDECRRFFHEYLPARRHGPESVQTAVLHHTAGREDDDAARVWGYHRDTLGWGTDGYGLFVGRDGKVEYWVGPSDLTNGVWGLNAATFHVVTPGHYAGKHEPTAAQLDAIYRAFLCIDDAWGGEGLRWRGHKEVALPGHGTACPGSLVEHLRAMRGVRFGAAALVGAERPEHYTT